MNETLLSLRDLKNPEISKLFKTEKYFSAYGKTFVPYRKFDSAREKQLVDSLSTSENMAVRVPKDKDKYSYSLKNFKKFTESFDVDIFYCIEDKRFCSPYKDGLRSLNVSKLRKFYASELVEYKKENKELISVLENRNLNAEIIRNNLKNALSKTATEILNVEFSRDNYNTLFPLAQVDSPIEHIKLGENQFEKLEKKHREKYLSLVYETLTKPSLVINEQRISDNGNEISHNYIKSFVDESKIEGFQSVIVKIGKYNVSVTSHNRDLKNILSKIIMPEQLVYLRPEVGQAIEQHTHNGQEMVNQTKGINLANESAYSTDISRPSNPFYDETKLLSILDLTQKTKNSQEKIMDRNTKGLSDKDIEKAWESLENEPFTTNGSGEQVLDDDNGWFGFSKGTSQQEIWHWFDTHYSKGVAYLVNDYEPEENIDKNITKENKTMAEEETISWDEIQHNADGTHWNDEALAVKNRAKEQAVEFANEIGEEIDANNEDSIEDFIKGYDIYFQQDGAMAENRHVPYPEGNRYALDYVVNKMLVKFLDEETEKNADVNRNKEFASNFSRNSFTEDDTKTILKYANHLNDGSALWMLGAKIGNERQLYYRASSSKPDSSGWHKATVQEFFDFAGDFYAHNYDPEDKFDVKNLPMMKQLFPNSKDIDKIWRQHYTKDDMAPEDVSDLSDHSAHSEIWGHLPSVDDDVGNPYISLEDAVEAAASYLENNDGLKDNDFGNRSDSTEENKATRKKFLSLLKNMNNLLHSDEFPDNTFSIENVTAENLDLLHAEVLKNCAALAREDFLSSFGEIIDGEYPNQEEAEYRRHTLNELRIDEKNLDNYLDDNASRLLENVYEKARSKSVGLYDFIEATVDTSDPTDEQEVEWNSALAELLDGYTDYKDFNEKWDVSLTPTTARLHWLESEKDLIHIAFDNAFGNDSVEVPAGAENYKEFLDSIDFENRFSLSNLLRAETLQMDRARLQEKNINEDKDIERFSSIFAEMEAPDLFGKSKDIKGLIENYKENKDVKLPIVEAISTMLYDSPQIHENGTYSSFNALSMENFDNKHGVDGTDARNELCDMVAEKIVADKSIKNIEQVKKLLKTDSEKILKEELSKLAKNKTEEPEINITDWATEENFKNATGLTRNEIFEKYGTTPEVIGAIPNEYMMLFPQAKNNNVYCSKGYFIDHMVNHHPEVSLEDYNEIYSVLKNPKQVFADIKNKSIVLASENKNPKLKENLVLKLDSNDRITFYKSYFNGKENKRLIEITDDIRKELSVVVGDSTISHAEASGSPRISARTDIFSIIQNLEMSSNEQDEEVKEQLNITKEAVRNLKKENIELKEKLEEQTMKNEQIVKISEQEMNRLSKIFEGKTCLDSSGTKEVDFKGLVEDYKEDKDPEDVLKDAISMMIHSNRDTEEYYDFSPSIFDFENEKRDEDGYEMRWELCDKTAEKIINDKTITTMDQVETIMSMESSELFIEYVKEEQHEQEWPGLASWKELADIVGKDIYSFKDDVLESNEGISEKDWKTEALARTLNDGVLDLRGFDTESTSRINALQYDSDFMKSDKGEVYKAINPEKWDVLTKVAESTVGTYGPEIAGTTAETLQQKYDEELSKDRVYLQAVEKGLVEIDKNMAERIIENNYALDISDDLKIALVMAEENSRTDIPVWRKPERFILTPSSRPDDYIVSQFQEFMEGYRDSSKEPVMTDMQAKIIMDYLRKNDYALFVDKKGSLNCVDFSEDFNTENIEIMTTKDLLLLTKDLINKDIGFEDRAEGDLKKIQVVLNGYEKVQEVSKSDNSFTISESENHLQKLIETKMKNFDNACKNPKANYKTSSFVKDLVSVIGEDYERKGLKPADVAKKAIIFMQQKNAVIANKIDTSIVKTVLSKTPCSTQKEFNKAFKKYIKKEVENEISKNSPEY